MIRSGAKLEDLYTPEELEAFNKLKAGALQATELFSEDELEEYAAAQAQKEEPC